MNLQIQDGIGFFHIERYFRPKEVSIDAFINNEPYRWLELLDEKSSKIKQWELFGVHLHLGCQQKQLEHPVCKQIVFFAN